MSMKKRAFFLILMLSSGLAAAKAQNKAYKMMLKALLSHSVPEINVSQAKLAHDNQTVFLDAREIREYEISHIPNARFVGYNDFTLDRIKDIPRDSPIIVYCSVGYRSEKVADKLIAAGFSKVSNLYGGIFQWVNESNIVLDNTNTPTPQVHAYNRTWGVWLKNGKKVYK